MGTGQLTSIGVTDIAFHPEDPLRMWIATGDGDFGDTRSIGVWASQDGGESWEATSLDWAPFMGRTQTRIVVHPPTTRYPVDRVQPWGVPKCQWRFELVEDT